MVFSIVVPMYNAAPYIERCLNSVFEQNIEEDKYELLIINDGSPDNSEQIARELSNKKKNVRILTQENKGLGGARNTGIENAVGEYLIFLDADDYLEPNCLTLIYKTISGTEFEKVDIFELACNSVSDQSSILISFIPDHIGEIYSGIDYYLQAKSISSACNKLYRRKSLDTLRFKERIYIEDSEFNTRAFFFFQKICALDIVISNFVLTTGSITRNKNEDTKNKLVADTLEIFKSFQQFEDKYSTRTETENQYFSKKYTLYTVTIFNLLIKYNMKVSEALKIKKDLKDNDLFILNYEGLVRKKDLFRKLLKYSFTTYIFILGIRNQLS